MTFQVIQEIIESGYTQFRRGFNCKKLKNQVLRERWVKNIVASIMSLVGPRSGAFTSGV